VTTQTHPEVKRVGETGQVSVGKSLAGKLVRVEPTRDGVFLRFIVDVAENDAWWTHEPYKSQLQKALAWAEKTPPAATDLGALLARATSAQTSPAQTRTRTGAAKRVPARRAAKKKKKK
jgi:hypothetical protein